MAKANPEHFAALMRGANEWNSWREKNPNSKPDLKFADLRGTNLYGADLSEADLGEADLRSADLRKADLRRAYLCRTDLRGADLSEADLGEADLREANACRTQLYGAKLRRADLRLANLQFSILDGAILTEARLWGMQRAGWSIKNVKCENVFWDAGLPFWDSSSVEATIYAPGEFEKHHSDRQAIELLYKGGITRFELHTLPALLHRLESVDDGCVLRLKSVEDAPGGTKVLIVVEEAGAAGLERVKTHALELQAAQLELRDEKRLRERLAIENLLLLNDVFPRMMAAAKKTEIIVSAPVGNLVVDSSQVTAEAYQTINETAAIRVLVDEIFSRRTELALQPSQLATLEQSIESVQRQLKALRPNASAIREGLKTVRSVIEGAVGSTLAAAWWPALNQLLQSLH